MVAFKGTSRRFWEKVDVCGSDECWRWKGSLRGGYGRFTISAHTWAYESEVGPVNPGLTLDHTCKDPICVNPAHLEQVTLGENIRRHHAKALCKRGHPLSGQNVRINRRGVRVCRACAADRWRRLAADPEFRIRRRLYTRSRNRRIRGIPPERWRK